jgi:sigma-E factor negative regulatory protein RseC
MIEEQGRVVEIDPDGVWIEVEKHSACAGCSARSGCGQRLLAEHSAGRQVVICVDNPDLLTVNVDDRVVVGIAEGAFMKASLALYLLPLLLLFLLSAVADLAGASEGITVIAGLLGLAVGLGLVRYISRHWHKAQEYHPVLIRVS